MLERLRTLIGGKAQTNRAEYVHGTVKPADVYGYSRAPERQARAIQHLVGYVYAASMLNARSIASQPLKLYAKAGKTSGLITRSVSKSGMRYLRGDTDLRPAKSVMAATGQSGDIVEIYDHPVLDLLHKVSPFIDGYQFTVLRKIMLQATGNEYLHPIIGPLGYPVELHVLPSQMVRIHPVRDERIISHYSYGQPPSEVQFQPDEVLHNKTPSPIDPYYGVGWVTAAESSANLLEQMDGYEQHLFENQARPDWGIFLKDNLNESQWNRMVAYIDQNLRGNRNSGRPYIFEGGSDARPLQFSPRDLAFSDGELRKVEAIAAVSGVPVSLLRANDPNLASAEVGFASYMRDTIHPYLISDTEFLNQQLLPLFGSMAEDLFLAYENPVAEDVEQNSRIFLAEVAAGVRTINEARAELGLEPSDEGDELRVNGVPLDLVGQPAPLGTLSAEDDEAQTKSAKATRSQVRVGSIVSWRTQKGKYLGKIQRLQTSGSGEGVVGDPDATEEDPIAHVQVYIRNEDDTYTPSDRVTPVRVSRLTPADEPELSEKAVSKEVEKRLEKKVEEHNEEHGDAKGKRATLGMLKTCYERGLAAYRGNPASVRPTVSGADQWAMARVNGLLHALRTGKFKRKPYDQDLLPAEHPLSSKDKKRYGDDEERKAELPYYKDYFTTLEEAEARAAEIGCTGIHTAPGDVYGHDGVIYMPCDTHGAYVEAIEQAQKKYEDIDFTPPAGVREEARRGLDWRAEHGRGGTLVGVARARDLSNGESMSPDTIRRMTSFFARHEVDKQGEGFDRGEDGYPSAGRIAWALWGGDAGQTWAESVLRQMEREDGQKVAREPGESVDACVSRGVDVLMAEGYERDQAVAIAYSQCGQRTIRCCTGMESGVCMKSAEDGGEDWHPEQKAARQLVEEVQDFETPSADTDVERQGEPDTPATQIARGVSAVLRKQKDAILKELQSSQKSLSRAQMFSLLGLVSGFEKDIADAVLDPMVLALTAGHQYASDEAEIDISGSIGDAINVLGRDYAEAHAASLSKQMNAATVREVRRIISNGITERQSIEDITKALEQNTVFDTRRARIVARTETARAFTEGELQAMEQSDSVAGKKWLKAPMACPFCEQAAKATQSGPIGVRDPFLQAGIISAGGRTMKLPEPLMAPPLHPNCRCGIRSVRRKIVDE